MPRRRRRLSDLSPAPARPSGRAARPNFARARGAVCSRPPGRCSRPPARHPSAVAHTALTERPWCMTRASATPSSSVDRPQRRSHHVRCRRRTRSAGCGRDPADRAVTTSRSHTVCTKLGVGGATGHDGHECARHDGHECARVRRAPKPTGPTGPTRPPGLPRDLPTRATVRRWAAGSASASVGWS